MYKWYTSCLLVPTDKHLDDYDLMEGVQRDARAGCSGTIDNLLIDRMVTLDCHRKKRNLSMGWVDVKKAYRSWLARGDDDNPQVSHLAVQDHQVSVKKLEH